MVHVHGRHKANMSLGYKRMELLGKILTGVALNAVASLVTMWLDICTTPDAPIGDE